MQTDEKGEKQQENYTAFVTAAISALALKFV